MIIIILISLSAAVLSIKDIYDYMIVLNDPASSFYLKTAYVIMKCNEVSVTFFIAYETYIVMKNKVGRNILNQSAVFNIIMAVFLISYNVYDQLYLKQLNIGIILNYNLIVQAIIVCFLVFLSVSLLSANTRLIKYSSAAAFAAGCIYLVNFFISIYYLIVSDSSLFGTDFYNSIMFKALVSNSILMLYFVLQYLIIKKVNQQGSRQVSSAV